MGMFLLGSVFAAQFGMSAVYGSRAGLSVGQISLMVSGTYLAALVLQYPIGWLSDRMDRRKLILGLALAGGVGSLLSFVFAGHFWLILVSAAAVGGTSNPLYALLIAYANDYLDRADMAAASGGLLFINGLGAIAGPLILGWIMDNLGASGFWAFIALLMLGLAGYAGWRMTRRKAVENPDRASYAPIGAQASPVAAGLAQEVYRDASSREQSVPDRDKAA
jgi:MFS family permease